MFGSYILGIVWFTKIRKGVKRKVSKVSKVHKLKNSTVQNTNTNSEPSKNPESSKFILKIQSKIRHQSAPVTPRKVL